MPAPVFQGLSPLAALKTAVNLPALSYRSGCIGRAAYRLLELLREQLPSVNSPVMRRTAFTIISSLNVFHNILLTLLFLFPPWPLA
jgi:hypothetical protein